MRKYQYGYRYHQELKLRLRGLSSLLTAIFGTSL